MSATAADDVAPREVRVRDVPGLLDALRGSAAWLDLSYVVELDGAVVGHVSFTRGWVDAETSLVDVLVLSPLSVRPDVQRRGHGRAVGDRGADAACRAR